MGKVTLPKGFDPHGAKHWYLVANRTAAVVYEGDLRGGFRFVRRLRNITGHLRDLRLVSDGAGRSFAYREPSNGRRAQRENEASRLVQPAAVASAFARRISGMLDRAAHEAEFTDLVIMAEPQFLGFLRKALPKRVAALVRKKVAREWSQGSDRELETFLRKKLA